MDGDRGELRRLLEVRVPDLVAYQSRALRRRYAGLVARVQVAEQERAPGHGELAEAVARHLFKLMAYKDEYEVARLHLDAVERAQARPRVRRRTRKVWYNLHPPLLRALGMKRKLRLGALVRPRLPPAAGHAPAARHAARPVRPGAACAASSAR